MVLRGVKLFVVLLNRAESLNWGSGSGGRRASGVQFPWVCCGDAFKANCGEILEADVDSIGLGWVDVAVERSLLFREKASPLCPCCCCCCCGLGAAELALTLLCVDWLWDSIGRFRWLCLGDWWERLGLKTIFPEGASWLSMIVCVCARVSARVTTGEHGYGC